MARTGARHGSEPGRGMVSGYGAGEKWACGHPRGVMGEDSPLACPVGASLARKGTDTREGRHARGMVASQHAPGDVRPRRSFPDRDFAVCPDTCWAISRWARPHLLEILKSIATRRSAMSSKSPI